MRTPPLLPRHRTRRGANAVEFALTLPVFVGMLFGLVDFGWYFAQQAVLDISVNRACREGAMIDPLTGDPQGAAREVLDEVLAVLPGACTEGCEVTIDEVGTVPGRSIRCQVDATYRPFVGFWNSTDHQQALTLMRYEWQR